MSAGSFSVQGVTISMCSLLIIGIFAVVILVAIIAGIVRAGSRHKRTKQLLYTSLLAAC